MGLYLEKSTLHHQDIRFHIDIVSLFMTARQTNQLYMSINRWITGIWYIYKIEYLAIKKSEIMKTAGKWMELQNILRSLKLRK